MLKWWNSHSPQCINYWWPNFHLTEEAMLDPTGDIPLEHTRADLLRRIFLLFALELALRSHTHIHTHFSTHIHSLSAFFTLLHQSVPKLFPHFGEFPRLIPWHKWILGLITLAWTHQVCPVPAKRAHAKNSYLPLLVVKSKCCKIQRSDKFSEHTHISNNGLLPETPRHHSIYIDL